MHIAVIGTGNVGGTLGRRWAELGHTVTFGTRDPQREKIQALLTETHALAATPREAATQAEVIVIATPWAVTEVTVKALGDLSGKIVIDCTNPIGPGFKLLIGHTTSAGEQVADWAVGAHVVKAYNTIGYDVMANPRFGSQAASLLICGDDARAKGIVTDLSNALGFDTVDCGPLTVARYLEPLCMLWLQLAIGQGLGRNIVLNLVRR